MLVAVAARAAMAEQFILDPHALHRLRRYHRDNAPKHKALGARSPRAHVSNRLLFSHDEVRAVKVKGDATESDVEAGRTSHLCKKGNDFADTFAKKREQIHTSPHFASPKLLLVRPWPSKRHVGRPKRTFCSGSGSGTTPGLPRHDQGYGPPRARLKRKREKETAAPAAGLVSDWLSPIFPLTFLARQSPRPSHIQRAQLAIGTRFRCRWPSFGQRFHLLRQVWSGLLGAERMHFAANAANSQGAERRSCAN